MFRLNFLFFFILANGVYVILVDALVKDEKVTPGKPQLANDGTLYVIDYFTMYIAAMVMYKLLFAILHLIRFKCCAHKYTPDVVNLDVEVKRMKKKSLDDSVAEDILLDIRDYLADEAEREDKVDRKNDELLASVSPADFREKVDAMAKVSMHKKKSMYSGRNSAKGKSVHWHKSVYADQDDDIAGFLPAVEEEKKDIEDARL